METKDITPKEYAGYCKKSLSAITKKIRNNTPMDFVIQVKNWSRFYTLEVPNWLNADSFKTEPREGYKKK